jgi:hypothetical protein
LCRFIFEILWQFQIVKLIEFGEIGQSEALKAAVRADSEMSKILGLAIVVGAFPTFLGTEGSRLPFHKFGAFYEVYATLQVIPDSE